MSTTMTCVDSEVCEEFCVIWINILKESSAQSSVWRVSHVFVCVQNVSKTFAVVYVWSTASEAL